ncbi:MAG TPA: enolase C-terminal domain-like protein [Ktedonobacteraceae bacterium]|nr:enolase C-terminal domain-like protein [Ktedonobacteraceae bacterium]
MNNPRITALAWGCLEGRRPRVAGYNARLGEHGDHIRLPLLHVTTEDGCSGFGWCDASKEQAVALLGERLDDVFLANRGVVEAYLAFDYPLWDLVGQHAGLPVYAVAAIAGKAVSVSTPMRVPCYDTSLYFDDLHIADEAGAAHLLVEEAQAGYRRGHRAFKVKIGRGARHMPLEEGTRRDIAIIQAIRRELGSDVAIMLDANNGYNLNLTKTVLEQTAASHITWIEEAFHEDQVLYRDLHDWLQQHNLAVLVSDGEGDANPHLLDWAREGLVNVIQYDIYGHGFTRWLATGRQLDAWKVYSAPHHYGSHYGNYAACHLAGGIDNLIYVEWDEATTAGLDTSGYSIAEGQVMVPASPGFGLTLDEGIFRRAVADAGYTLTL